jgi:hypothetical protein
VAKGFETGKVSELSSLGGLACHKKDFQIPSFPAKFEGREIPVPQSLGDIRLRLDPEAKQVEIIDTESCGRASGRPGDRESLAVGATSSRFAALFPENEAAQLVAEFLDHVRVF